MAAPLVIAAGIWGYRAYQAYRIYRAAQAAAQAAQAARVVQAARAAQQLAMAAKRAEELSKAKERDKVCEDCPKKVPCFDPPPNGDEAELMRQLKDQQDAINKMSPDQILDQIKKYKELGREGAAPGEAALRALERTKYENERAATLIEKFQLEGMELEKATSLARAQAQRELKNLHVLHTPDLRAGGTGLTGGLGDRSVNRHLGNQWKNGRADALEAAAQDAKARGQEQMDVKLEKC
jgi:hypothetical protein